MLKINELARLHLGVKGENLSKTIEIDMSAWAEIYPNATAVLLHKRYGDATKELTGATYDSDTQILTWIPTSTDTYYEGWGVAEIRMMEGEVVKKTKDLIVTAVSPSVINGTGTVIASTYQAWLDSVIAEKTASVAAKNAAEGYSEDAEAWAKGTRAGEDVESTDPAYENNAKYYAELAGDAKDDAVDAKEAAEDAQEAAETAQHAAEDAQEAAEAAQTGAQAAAGKYPEIGENHNWYIYNPATQQYEDTGTTARGISGVTPDMQIGTVETLSAGSPATASITGTAEEPVLNLGIPKGADGAGTIQEIKMNGSTLPIDDGEVNLGTVVTDQSGKADKVSGGTSGNFAALDANGNLTDSGKKASDFVTDVSGKADKVSGGTSGNFASLDSSGNLADSGHKHSDYLTSHQDISGKADKVSGATNGNFAALDSNGNLTDSGKKASDFVTDVSGKLDKANVYNGMDKTDSGYALDARQGVTINTSIGTVRKGIGYVATMSGNDYKLPSGTDAAIGDYIWKGSYLGKATAAITGGSTVIVENTNWVKVPEGAGNELRAGKADKVSGGTSGNFAALDSNGNLTDSGHKHSDYLTSHQDISGKADKVSGATSGDVATLDENGNLVDSGKTLGKSVPADAVFTDTTYSVMTGAGSSAAGASGLVPAPAAGDNVYYLRGDGTWNYPPGSKLVVKDLDTVTNTSGSYTHSTTLSDVTADMKAIKIELGNPDAFLDRITITTADGSITLSCNSVEGTSTVKVSLIFVAGANTLTSSEFDVLAGRIGTLSSLHTTAKTDVVSAVNELSDQIGNIPSDAVSYSKIKSKPINFTGITFTAGTIGTRGYQSYQSASIGNGKILGLYPGTMNDSSKYIPVPFVYGGYIYLNLYRATTSAVSGESVQVIVVYVEE